MTDRLVITLLGHVQFSRAGRPLSFVYTKAQALLCYLAVTARAHSRDTLSTLLWGEMPDRDAKNNLRNSLSNLSHLVAPHLIVTRETVAFDLSSSYELDVQGFLERLAPTRRAAPLNESELDSIRKGMNLYQGEFLDGFFVREAPAFEEWMLAERENLRLMAVRGLDALIAHHSSRGECAPGIEYCRRLLAIEPLQEQAHRQLMLLLALDGQRSAALAQYETCRRVLRQELDVEPMPETISLYNRIASIDLGKIATVIEPAPPIKDQHVQLVGRTPEFARIRQVWEKTASGSPQFVVILGEAGIGKTRLAEEMVVWVAEQSIATAIAQVHEFEGNLLYEPVIEWLRSDAIRSTLPLVDDVWLSEVARLLPELLTKRPTLGLPAPITDANHRTRFFEALARAVLLSKRPLVLWLDDLQWCDRETLAWLPYLLRHDPRARLLVLATLRVEETAGNPGIADLLFSLRRTGQLTEIELCPLDEGATAALAAHVAGRPLSPAQTTRLFRESAGNPLFLTEMVRAGFVDEPGNGEIQARLPPTMLAVITRRLAQLSPPAHELAGVAATIDHVFDLNLLSRISGQEEAEVLNHLEELIRRRILHEMGEATYDLSHPKIREVAYAEQSSARRQELHRRVACALEARHADSLDAVSAQIAVHFERAGLAEQAISYYERAAYAARRVFAHPQAIEYLGKASELLSRCSPGAARDRQELKLQIALGMALGANRGWASADAANTFTRARQLATQIGQTPDLLPILVGLTLGNLNAGRVKTTLEMGSQLLDLSRATNNMGGVMGARFALGCISLFKGDFAGSLSHGEQGIAVYDPLAHGELALAYGQDGGVNCRNVGALSLWFLGYPDRAVQMSNAALALARKLSNLNALAGALLFASWLHQLRGDVEATRKHLDELIPLATERRFPIWLGLGLWLRGWALATQGECIEGIQSAQRGLDLHDEIGEGLARPVGLVLLAETYRLNGQFEQAEAQLAQSLQNAEQNEQRIFASEAERLRGEILIQKASSPAVQDAAEACFMRALTVAREQNARSLELRAATSLCRLWRRQGRSAQAHPTLAEVVGQFTGGFETADWRQAKALLDELATS